MLKRNFFIYFLIILLTLTFFYTPKPLQAETIAFKDKNLEQIIRDTLSLSANEAIQASALKTIEHLDASNNHITSLEGIEHLSNLKTLDIAHNQVSDLSPLVPLSQLEELYANNNLITSIFSIRYLTELKTLSLSANTIADVQPLSNLNKLTDLRLNNNMIRTIEALSNLIKLQRLYLNENQINDLTSISNLLELQYLWVDHNLITSIEPISNLTRLKSLHVQANSIEDLTPIKRLYELQSLWLNENKIQSIDPIYNLVKLKELFIQKNYIELLPNNKPLMFLRELEKGEATVTYFPQKDDHSSEIIDVNDQSLEASIREVIRKPVGPIYKNDVSSIRTLSAQGKGIQNIDALKYFTSLETLNLSHNQIDTVSPLKELTSLRNLYLSDNNIDYLWGLKDLTALETLSLSGNNITSVSFLQSLTNLTSLNLNNNSILAIYDLASLTKLEELHLSNNQIKNIEPLAALTNLETLWLDDNRIRKIDALKRLYSLKALHLNQNQITDLSDLERLYKLTDLYVQDNNLVSIEPIKKLYRLSNLDISHNKIAHIDIVADLDNLESFYAAYNNISNMTPLERSYHLANSTNGQNNRIVDLRYNALLLSDSNTKRVVSKLEEAGNEVLIKPQAHQKVFDFETMYNVQPLKQWTITFNVKPSYFKNRIHVLDDEGNDIPITVQQSGKNLIVNPPYGGYKENKRYTLMIEQDIKFFNKNSPLLQPVRMAFTVKTTPEQVVEKTVADVGGVVLDYVNRSAEIIIEARHLNVSQDREAYLLLYDGAIINLFNDGNGYYRATNIPKDYTSEQLNQAIIKYEDND